MDLSEPIPPACPSPCAKTLVDKLIAAIGEIDPIPKRGVNGEAHYAYATLEDIVLAIRGPLARHGLLIVATLKERASEAVHAEAGADQWRERLLLAVTVTDGETALTVDAPGEGRDGGDKAVYKAWSGAFKYALRSLLQLPFGDDPEATSDARPQHAAPQDLDLRGGVEGPEPGMDAAAKAESRTGDPYPPPRRFGAMAPATDRQRRAIRSRAASLRMDESQLAQALAGIGVRSLDALTKPQASHLLDTLCTPPPSPVSAP